ncbi:hypothetical protein B0H14DRAFT_2561810 [Mycena olivaceomarginata]|nr:hypothetical protein B0H14DRAFT_2561810 [Mycena olivaceomarginata]
MNSGHSATASVLPSEMEREIFELAALSRPVSIPDLLRVAWRVKHWCGSHLTAVQPRHLTVSARLEPLLYRTLLIGYEVYPIDGYRSYNMETFTRIARTNSKSAVFLRESVRNLMLYGVSARETGIILSTCPGVENLCIFAANWSDGMKAGPPADTLSLQHLYCDLSDLGEIISISLADPVFRHITHLALLDLHSVVEPEQWTHLTGLTHLTNRTHLSFHSVKKIPVCPHILVTFKSLRALIILSHLPTPPPPELDILAENRRFVMMVLDSLTADWQRAISAPGIITGRARIHL